MVSNQHNDDIIVLHYDNNEILSLIKWNKEENLANS